MNKLKNVIIKDIIICGAVMLLLIIFFNSYFTVREDEYAVVKQFGEIKKVYEKAGPKFKIPFINSVETVKKSIKIYEIASSDVLTSDKKTMIVDNFVIWNITDPKKFKMSLVSTEKAEGRIDAIVYNSLKNTIASMPQEEVILSREQIKNNVKSSTDLSQYGIDVKDVSIKRLDMPDSNREAVFTRMISERNSIATEYLSDGDEQASKIRNDADSQANNMINKANSDKEIIISEGENEYMKIIQSAYDSEDKKEFYDFVLSLDALKESLKGDKTIFLPLDSQITKILKGQ